MKLKEKINEIHRDLKQGKITQIQATEKVLNLIAVIDTFEIDARKLSQKDQLHLQTLMFDGKITINVVL